MDNFYGIENLEIIEIDASEEIGNKNLKNFITTSLKLKNINLSKKHKIILNYIKELKIYQLILVDKNQKKLELELFSSYFDNSNSINFISFFYKNHLLIFKNSKLYYLQKIKEDIKTIELLNYLNKNFQITIENFIGLNSEDLQNKKLKTSSKKIDLDYFSMKNNYSFIFYIFYIVLILFFTFFIFFQKQNVVEYQQNEELLQIKNLENIYKFNSFEQSSRKIIYKLEQNSLNLESFEFNANILKLQISSKNKENIYKFFEDKEINLLNSNINFVENDSIYKAQLDVQLFK